MKKTKVRFAPSPTGPLHIGGARSALFNYLYAEHCGGEMVLRIEDTDLDRSHREYEEEIIESLQWLGLTWTEGVNIGGDNGPYRQTERLDIYRQYVQQLIDQAQAYYCFCSQEELEAERQEQYAQGLTPRYGGKCSQLDAAEVNRRLAAGEPASIRFRVPHNTFYVVNDLVRDTVSFESGNSGDFIIVKSDGIPVYNFAVVIDDHLMEVTHVIRAEEHLSNTPRQLMIYDALKFPRPEFAHISLILGDDHQKMSKRHGATSLVQYREKGYLPEALFNFLALLGWSPEGEQEIMTKEEIIKSFTLDRVAKSPAVFNIDKLNWMNQQYIKQLSTPELMNLLLPYIQNCPYAGQWAELPGDRTLVLVEAIREHLVCLSDVEGQMGVFFQPLSYDPEAWEILQQENSAPVLQRIRNELPEFTEPQEIKQFIKSVTKDAKLKPKDVFMPLRSALSGRTHGPELPSMIYVWGRENTLNRLDETMQKLGF
ncbi:MAG: glutamate--tRNA ligase [Syntrophomonadaceae bacterium]|nr:glutamate--tRNA ligase [Syntrophomonadaceae bacterium]